jgi:hypothetical protein
MPPEIKSTKFSMLFPETFIIKDFLEADQLMQLRAIFKTRKAEFQYAPNEDGSLGRICRTHLLIEEAARVPWLRMKFETAFQNLCESLKLPNNMHLMLSFKKFYFKFYVGNDYYGKHVDISPCDLTFIYQFTSEGSVEKFSDLIFENGQRIPFVSNQLIIFHSSISHSFTNADYAGDPAIYKCLTQCFPEFT